ncbi:hypothetical protein [Lentzea sp. NPDC051838]|uniref:hypothetical protein n=1 Tax=Lentzea sp. NPDC051838 TaxID=3154849 RepID=UPI00342FA88B
MNIFGLTITRTRRGPSRAERNASAAGARSAEDTGGPEGVRIHRDELVLVERLIRTAGWVNVSGRWKGPVDEFVASLHVRLGAASAVEADPQFVPFLLDEIAIVERAVLHLDGSPDYRRLVGNGRQLLEDLRLRLGHAEAVRQLGEIAVFAQNPFPIDPLNP